MILHSIQTSLFILRCCHWAVIGMGCDVEARSNCADIVMMAHPYHRVLCNSLEYQALCIINCHGSLTILTFWGMVYLTTKDMHHELSAVAES